MYTVVHVYCCTCILLYMYTVVHVYCSTCILLYMYTVVHVYCCTCSSSIVKLRQLLATSLYNRAMGHTRVLLFVVKLLPTSTA